VQRLIEQTCSDPGAALTDRVTDLSLVAKPTEAGLQVPRHIAVPIDSEYEHPTHIARA
jgi:hypothetical protein